VSKAFEKKPGGKYVEYTTRHMDAELLQKLKMLAIQEHWTVEHTLNFVIDLGLHHWHKWKGESDAN